MMDINNLAWPRLHEIEEHLLPLIKPAPKTAKERSNLLKGLLHLVFQCQPKVNGKSSLLEQIVGEDYKDKVKDIRKAADLLEGTGLDFEEVVKELRQGATNIEAFGGPKFSDAERRNQCLEMCRDFLVSHRKHAGLKEANKETRQGAGGAIILTQAVLELTTRNPRTGRGLYVSDQALRKYAKRSRGDKKAKSEA